ncbi:MAG: hypothetical protein OHK0029_27420 [Armatimonadaceae bacterium]
MKRFRPATASQILTSSLTVVALPVATALCSSPAFASEVAAIELTAERNVIRADGRSTTVISARVFDSRGNAAPDGTRVQFTTTAGRLENNVVTTQNGVARVVLFSSDQPAEAKITAILDGAQSVPARITIFFRIDADNAQVEDDWLRMDGAQYCGYLKDYQVIQANGKDGSANFSYRSLDVSADLIQYNLRTGLLRAEGNVSIRNGNLIRRYDRLRFQVAGNGGSGIAERFEDLKQIAFLIEGPNMTESPWPQGRFLPGRATWELEDLSGASIAVTARSIAISREGNLQFRRATFYLDGRKMFSVPYHVMSQRQESLYQEQILGVGPQGLTVDFPYYYDVRPNAIGTMFVRHGARISQSAYSVRPGWWLDFKHDYNGKRETNGSVELLGLTRPDWGARMRHSQRLDERTTASMFVDFPFHRDVFVTSQLSRAFKQFNLNTTLSGSRHRGLVDQQTGEQQGATGDIRGQILAETYDRPLASTKNVRYAFNASLMRQSYYGNGAVVRGVQNSQTVGTRLYNSPLTVAPKTTLVQSLSLGQTWVQGSTNARSGITALGTTTLNHDVGNGNNVSFSYDYTETPVIFNTNSAFGNARHRLGLNANFSSGNAWSLFLSGNHALDKQQTSLSSSIDFTLGGPWRGQLQMYQSVFAGLRYQEMQYTLIRTIAGRQFAVHYSTTTRRFQFDFSGARF